MSTAPAPARTWFWRFVLAGAAAFLILLAAAAWIMREQILQTFLDPGIPFQTYERPPAPDYTSSEAWAVRPDALPEDPDIPAVFFVHPTTYEGGSHWNAPFDRPQEAEVLARTVLPNFAAPFLVSDAVLFAPHYRQAALYTFMNNREDSVQAREFAYQDVRAAFLAFLDEIGPDRPFLIAGAGQGASQALGVLIDEVAPRADVRERLAAAYLMESPVPLDLFSGPLAGLPPCHTPEDVRCVIAWASARQDERGRIEAITQRARAWDADGALAPVTGRELLCVNPVLWTTAEDFAPARLHRGGAAAEGLALTDSPSPMAGQTGAQCQAGVLMIDQPRTRALRRPSRVGEDRRTPPFNLFYMDIRTDAARRLDTLARVLEEERRWAPPLEDMEEVEVAPIVPMRNGG
ncbi:DUF3089 domain-containing protein [Alkalicaulis satelles]|uniref:DUF3089 domain-containing protein n=1 Tax=Alkalicaulis satelles TaxID=2609175 RepID=A0A5M6ZLQ3_9PROT|nr:DUF3089 domain-containing protein [Alkalicaulis satelles]KAA5804855.1 DUF3089 domain-containing protein [Alkalicaulis satelles]